MTAKPALPCPPWCDHRHAADDIADSHISEETRMADGAWAGLIMSDHGAADHHRFAEYDGRVSVQFRLGDHYRYKIIQFEPGGPEQEHWLEVLRDLGRGDLADAIIALAIVALAKPAGGGQ